MRYWIIKSRFACYSIDDFAREKKTLWTGIRNYLARNYMMNEMRPGDKFLFYHSNTEAKGIYGAGHVKRVNLVDETAFDKKSPGYDPSSTRENPKWICAEFEYDFHFKNPILLKDLKTENMFSKVNFTKKYNRLSILPIDRTEYDILTMADI